MGDGESEPLLFVQTPPPNPKSIYYTVTSLLVPLSLPGSSDPFILQFALIRSMDYDRNDALLHWLFRQTQGDAWFRPNEENISSGVALRVNHGKSR